MTTPATLSAWRLAMQGWRLALRAAARMPRLLGSSAVTAVVIGLLYARASTLVIQQPSDAIDAIFALAAQAVAFAFVWASCAIAVHRFVLLREAVDRFVWQVPSQFPRFYGRVLVLQVLFLPGVMISLVAGGHPSLLGVLAEVILGIASYIVSLRTMLLFPAVAIDAPGITWGNAWRDSKGHGWFLFRLTISLVVPVLPMWIGVIVVAGSLFGFGALANPLSPWGTVQSAIGQVITITSIWATAAAASRAYQIWGAALTRA